MTKLTRLTEQFYFFPGLRVQSLQRFLGVIKRAELLQQGDAVPLHLRRAEPAGHSARKGRLPLCVLGGMGLHRQVN